MAPTRKPHSRPTPRRATRSRSGSHRPPRVVRNPNRHEQYETSTHPAQDAAPSDRARSPWPASFFLNPADRKAERELPCARWSLTTRLLAIPEVFGRVGIVAVGVFDVAGPETKRTAHNRGVLADATDAVRVVADTASREAIAH